MGDPPAASLEVQERRALSAPTALAILGAVMLALHAGLSSLGDLRSGALVDALILHFAQSILLCLAMAVVLKTPARRGLGLILVFAALMRLVQLPLTPSLSDDIYRYLWEGRVQLEGFNPFLTAPASPELAGLRDRVWIGVNHREIPAIYPPVMQGLFLFNAAIHGGIVGIKALVGLFDLAVIGALVKLLERRGADPRGVLMYAWHPLVVTEVAGQGHFEPVALLFLLLFFLALEARRPGRASAALWLSIGVKYLPLAFVPQSLRLGGLRRAWIGPLVLAALFLPYLGDGWTEALGKYGAQWRFNDSGFWLLDASLKKIGVSQGFSRHVIGALVDSGGADLAFHQTYLLVLPKLLIAGGLCGLLGLAWWRRWPLERTVFAFFAAFFLFTPVLHPWYLLWIVALLPLRSSPAFLALSLSAPLSYEVLLRFDGRGETWSEALWVKALIFGAPLLAFALSTALGRRARAAD